MPRFGARALSMALVFAIIPAPAVPQQGPTLRFGLDTRLESQKNPNLSAGGGPRVQSATANLSFGYLRETRAERLSLDGNAVLRAGAAAGGLRRGLQDPTLRASYFREGIDGSLFLTARLRESEFSTLRSLEEFIDPETGLIELPEDFDALRGTGRRRETGLGFRLVQGEDRRIGWTTGADLTRRSYSGPGTGALRDSRRVALSFGLRLTIDAVTRANVTLRQSRFIEDGAGGARRTTRELGLSLRRDLPDGSIGGQIGFDRLPEGTRTSASLSRSWDLPTGSLSASIGAVRPAAGSGAQVTGSLFWSRETPQGRFDAQLRHSVGAGSDDRERVTTVGSVGFGRDLTDRSRLSMRLGHSESRTPGGGSRTALSSLTFDYRYDLDPNWGLSAGYQIRQRTESGAGSARADRIYLGLRRSWEF
ncbi:MAG: hypothetical protein ACK4KW_03400 [Gemmobacter sp.]